MSQSLKFTVRSAVPQDVVTKGEVDGETVDVKVPALVVEMVSSCGTMHPAFRFRKDLDAARAAFVPGAQFNLTFTPAEKDKA